jgi:hypothetical protein
VAILRLRTDGQQDELEDLVESLKRGDAVRFVASDGQIPHGALGVVVRAFPTQSVLVEFEGGKQLLPLRSLEAVTAIGATASARD